MLYTNISNLCKERNISIARLEREAGLGNATVQGWKSSVPQADKLKAVADVLGVTMDSLMQDTEDDTA